MSSVCGLPSTCIATLHRHSTLAYCYSPLPAFSHTPHEESCLATTRAYVAQPTSSSVLQPLSHGSQICSGVVTPFHVLLSIVCVPDVLVNNVTLLQTRHLRR